MTIHNRFALSAVPAQTRQRFWLLFFILVGGARLYLTGDRDIQGVNGPHDDFWYVADAMRLIWFGPFDNLAFAQMPVYSAWLLLLHSFGIPARLGIDVALVAGASYLALALNKLTHKVWPAALSFALILFHPYILAIFDRSLAETLASVLSIASMAAGIEIWTWRDDRSTRRRRFAAVAFGLMFALDYHTRKEGIVLLAPLLVIFAWSLIARASWWQRRNLQQLAYPLLVFPLTATITLGILIAGANGLRYGIFARNDLAAPQYVHAMKALNSIDAGQTPRKIAIDSHTMALAFAQSPTLAELQPYFDGSSGRSWAQYTYAEMGVSNEIASGWFYWAIRDFAKQAGWYKSAAFSEEKYAAVANEIDGAFAAHRLEKRSFVLSAFIDPDYGKWIPYLPQSAWRVFTLFITPADLGLQYAETATPKQVAYDTKLLGRRNPLPLDSYAGWAKAPSGSTLSLTDGAETLARVDLHTPERKDVPGGYPYLLLSSARTEPTEMILTAPNGDRGQIDLTKIKPPIVVRTEGAIEAQVAIDVYDRVVFEPRLTRAFHKIFHVKNYEDGLEKLEQVYKWVDLVFCLAALLAFLLAAGSRPSRNAVILIALALLATVIGRGMIFTILDASSWIGRQGRYIMPAVPSFIVMGALCASVLVDGLRSRRSAVQP